MFFESIKLLNGRIQNLEYHQQRLNRTLEKHFPEEKLSLIEALKKVELANPNGLFKVKVVYSDKIETMEVTAYEIKPHHKLKIVEIEDFDYSFKYLDRIFFEEQLAKNPDFEDIIFSKNGKITDTTYCNIAFYDGEKWFTPNTFLLAGTKRAKLLNEDILTEKAISLNHLSQFQQIAFINAMRDFEKKYTFTYINSEIHLTEI